MADDPRVICANSDGTNPLLNSVCAYGGYAVGSDIQSCVDAGNAFVADLDAKRMDVAQNWAPLPTFDTGQVRGIVEAVMSMLTEAGNVVTKAQAEPSASQDLLQNEQDELLRHGAQAVDYTTAANNADAAGTNVSAPNMKQWVLNAMGAASNALVTVYTVNCIKPWWVGSLAAFQTAFDTVWGLVKSILGAAVAVGEAAVDAVEGAATAISYSAKIIAFLFKWWPLLGLGVLAGGGYLVYRHRERFPSLDRILKRGNHAG